MNKDKPNDVTKSSKAPPVMAIEHAIQTNGTLLSEEWYVFFREHNYLVGLSLDGPRELHDACRVGRPTNV